MAIDTTNKLYIEDQPSNSLNPEEGVNDVANPLAIEIDDDKLYPIIDKRIKDAKNFFTKEYNLYERRKKMERFLFGRQINEDELKLYEARYIDNVLYEIEAAIKPLAMSRLPDLIVTPGTDNDEQRKTATDVSKVIDTDIKKRQNRLVLGIAFKHLPVYFVGVIKVVWKPELNDFIFKVIHPDYIEVDHTCQTNNADDMWFIAETIPITIQECILRFPDKKDDLISALRNDGVILGEGELSDKQLATQIKIREVWFKWQQKAVEGTNDEDTEINGVMLKYKHVILDKMKNPNYDWQGQEKTFIYDSPGDKTTRREVDQTDVMQYMMTGQAPGYMSKETVFRNFFDCPKFPYFFFGYDQWNKIPYDETSRIEQNIRNQEALDSTGKRVIDKLKQRTKHVFSKDGGLTAKHLEQMDMDDSRQDILIEGDVNKVHGIIPPEPVTQQEFKFLDEDRNRMYSLAGANAIRGELQTDVATSNQIAREADYTRADDLVEDTVNAACEWMARWSLQMMKLRYTEYHYRKLLGAQGSVTFLKIKGDMIDDGMEVNIKSSGTDKLRIKNQAMDMAKMQLIDPLSFYEDLGVSDPQGRVKRLMLFQSNPQEYLMTYGMGMSMQQGAAAIAAPIPGQEMGPPPAAQGGMPPPPMGQPTENAGMLPSETPPPQASPSQL